MSKHPSSKWFLKSNAKIDDIPIGHAMKQFHIWESAQDGLVGRYTKFFNEHSFETVDIFIDEEAGKDFIKKREAHATFQAQQLYFEENQITVKETIY